MKTVADLKRAIKKGVKLHCIFHQAFGGRDEAGTYLLKDEDRGVREVNIVQSNSFTLLTPQKQDPTILVDSWLNWPKAKEFKPINDNTFMVMVEDFRAGKNGELIPLCTYTII